MVFDLHILKWFDFPPTPREKGETDGKKTHEKNIKLNRMLPNDSFTAPNP